jgi:cation transport protein ChaC
MPRSSPPVQLTREALLGDAIRALVEATDPTVRLLSPEEHRASLQAALDLRPERGDVWIFAYGSLIWNPLIRFVEKRIATVHGYHRRFCLWTHVGRGTSSKPGLLLGLEHGGACRGVAYRVAAEEAAQELEILWRREMVTGAYAPRWVTARTAAGPVLAIAFLINRRHPRYAGDLPEKRIVAAIAEAQGPLGDCATYLFNTVAHLDELGIRDVKLRSLRDRVAARLQANGRTLP